MKDINVLDVEEIEEGEFYGYVSTNIGNIVIPCEEQEIRNLTSNYNGELSQRELENAVAVLVLTEKEKYEHLPRLSECSELLKYAVEEVLGTDYNMCYVDYDDWAKENFSLGDLVKLKEEIEEYNLEKVLEVDNGEYMILGYSDLMTKFIDDRHIDKTRRDIEDILYNVRNEFENELDSDYQSEVKEKLEDKDFDLMIEFLDRYLDKVYALVEERERENGRY